MSAAQQAQSANAWPEPPWSGWIETTGDALLILEAARRGLIPRVTRRLVDSERKMITSGSVFVFDEDESGIKRWTDGFFWSPSRILGNFLLYRETDKKGAGHRSARAEQQDAQDVVAPATSFATDSAQSLSRPKTDNTGLSIDKQRERHLIGSLTNSYKFKADGLMKKTFSVTIGGVAQHLISYYKVEDVESGRLRKPSSLPELRSLDISPEYLDKTHFRNPPKVEVGVDGVPRYSGEADDLDNSPSILPNPLSTSGMPLLTEGRLTDHSMTQKRSRRFEPYNAPPAAKRARPTLDSGVGAKKSTRTQDSGSSSSSSDGTPTAEPVSPQESASTATPQPAAAVAPMPIAPLPPPGAYPPPPYGMHAFYSMPGYPPQHHPHGPPPAGMYTPPPVGPAGAPGGLHYAYPYPPPPPAPGTAPAAPAGSLPTGSPQQQHVQTQTQGQAQGQGQAQEQQQQQQAQQQQQQPAAAQTQPAPAQVHRTDPSQSPQTAPPPGAPAQASVGHPFQPPPPHAQAPYYGYYHQPPPPQPGVGVGMHPHPHHPHSPMGVGIQYAGYPSWPMYSGFPPPPSLPQAHYVPPAPQAAVQVPVVQPPAQKREEGRVGDGGGGGT